MLEYALINYKVHVVLKHPAAIQNLMGGEGGGLSQCMGRAQGALNAVKKYLIVKLLAISLQAYKLTKNVLLHTYFSRILARF